MFAMNILPLCGLLYMIIVTIEDADAQVAHEFTIATGSRDNGTVVESPTLFIVKSSKSERMSKSKREIFRVIFHIDFVIMSRYHKFWLNLLFQDIKDSPSWLWKQITECFAAHDLRTIFFFSRLLLLNGCSCLHTYVLTLSQVLNNWRVTLNKMLQDILFANGNL